MKTRLLAAICLVLLLVSMGGKASAGYSLDNADHAPLLAPVGTSFTYQGHLEDDGNPANGNYSLRFSLWDDPTSGTQVGSDVAKPDVSIVDGLFVVELDFGDVFAGEALWLEIEVQGPGESAYTTLSPRQALTPVPFAVHADKVDGYDVELTTGYLAVPSSAFAPIQADTDYDNHGDYLMVYDYDYGNVFSAPVYLPQGAVVTSVTFYYYDSDPAAYNEDPTLSGDARVNLYRVAFSDRTRTSMADLESSGSGGNGSMTDSSINNGTVDNASYFYYLMADMPQASLPFDEVVKLHAVLIEYLHPALQ